MGRPALSPAQHGPAIAAAVREGASFDDAARIGGVSPSTAHRWLAAGAEPGASKAFREFRESVTRARVEAKLSMVALVRAAAVTDWRAAAWWLARRHSDEYGRPPEITAPEPLALSVDTQEAHATAALERAWHRFTTERADG